MAIFSKCSTGEEKRVKRQNVSPARNSDDVTFDEAMVVGCAGNHNPKADSGHSTSVRCIFWSVQLACSVTSLQLVLIATSLNPLCVIYYLNRKWLLSTGSNWIENYHPKLIGFEIFLKNYRSHYIDNIESTARIVQHFHVQSHIVAKYSLGWTNSSSPVVHMELRENGEHYGAAHKDSSFDICRIKFVNTDSANFAKLCTLTSLYTSFAKIKF